MYRWVALLVWAQCACIPAEDPAEGDAAADAVSDAGAGADAALFPEPPGPAHAALTWLCGPDGVDELLVVLSATPGCGAAEARLEVTIREPDAAGDQVIGEGATGRAIDGEEVMAIVAGSITMVAADGAEGRYRLELADGSIQAGAYTASACPGAGCQAAGPVDGRCPGTYVVTAWTLDIPSFNHFALNDAVTRNLADGDLLIDLLVGADEPVIEVRDAQIAPDGSRVPDPAVPPGVPFQVAPAGDGLQTARPGEARVVVGPFRLAPDAASFYAPAVDFHLVLAELAGAFGADCQTFEGQLDGAFADRPEFTIPGRHDTDTDGDGTLDGWRVLSTLSAVRVDD